MEHSSFLSQLNPEARAELESLMVQKTYDRDEIVIAQEEESCDVFFVAAGSARVTVYSEDGKVVAYRDILEGEIFGELSAIDEKPRSASVIALAELRVGRLEAVKFRTLVENSPSFGWALLRHLAQQSRHMTERIFEYSTMLVRERLIAELLRLSEPLEDAGTAILRPNPTHFDLATRISTHREAVSREMSKLAKQNLISKEAGCLRLLDVARLRDYAVGNGSSELKSHANELEDA